MSSLSFKNTQEHRAVLSTCEIGPVPKNEGFTLVEMIVTLAIFALITSIMLARYKDFNGGIILTNLAYEIAITLRQAQVYGLSVRGSGAIFTSAYGIHIAWPTSNKFVLFVDADPIKDNKYTSSSEDVEIYTTSRGNTIDDFCATQTQVGGTVECGKTLGITFLDVMFLRPNPEAIFKTDKNDDPGENVTYRSASITVKSPTTGRTKTITIQSTGQISVQ